jgi:hypothetical protein
MDTGPRSYESLSKQWSTMGSIRGLTGWQKFETCPDWGAKVSLDWPELHTKTAQPNR